MKRSIIIFIISALVFFSSLVWLINYKPSGSLNEILVIAVLVTVLSFAIFRGISVARSSINKEPVEDELSKKVMTKASSLSYYISIYLWLVIMYLSDKTKLESHSLIGAGIMGMALIFLCCWFFVKYKGLKNE